MKPKIIILNKTEAYPIGDVLGLVIIWAEKENVYGEYFYTRQNDQTKLVSEQLSLDKKNVDYFDLKKYLISKIKHYHKTKVVGPEELKLFSAKSFYGYNPYSEDRFKWHEHEYKDIYLFLEYFSDFIDKIEQTTGCNRLKEIISFYKELKGKVSIKNI